MSFRPEYSHFDNSVMTGQLPTKSHGITYRNRVFPKLSSNRRPSFLFHECFEFFALHDQCPSFAICFGEILPILASTPA